MMTNQSPFFQDAKERPPPEERRKAKRDARIAQLDKRAKEARGPRKKLLLKLLDRRREHAEQITEKDRQKKAKKDGRRKVRAAKVAERMAARGGAAPRRRGPPTSTTSFADMTAVQAIEAIATMDVEALDNARIIEQGRDRGPRTTVIDAMDDRKLQLDGDA